MHEILDLDGVNVARALVSDPGDGEDIVLTLMGPGESFTLDTLEGLHELHTLLTRMLQIVATWPEPEPEPESEGAPAPEPEPELDP